MNTLSLRQIKAVELTADSLFDMFKINKTSAVDSYVIAKNLGFKINTTKRKNEIRNTRNRDSVVYVNLLNQNETRYFLAREVAKYIIDLSINDNSIKKLDVNPIIDALVGSILLPKHEVLMLYNTLVANNVSLDKIIENISIRYGVSKLVVEQRIQLILKEEEHENVSKKDEN